MGRSDSVGKKGFCFGPRLTALLGNVFFADWFW